MTTKSLVKLFLFGMLVVLAGVFCHIQGYRTFGTTLLIAGCLVEFGSASVLMRRAWQRL